MKNVNLANGKLILLILIIVEILILGCPVAPDDYSKPGIWAVYKGENKVLIVKNTPGPLISTALLPAGKKPTQHPFLSGKALDAFEENDLYQILKKSKSFEEFISLLKQSGYRIERETVDVFETQKKGSSYEDAIVIDETAMDKGILKEYEYLKQNSCQGNGGFEKEPSQDLYEQNGHYYHLMQVICKNGGKEGYYFMIDKFFGKIEKLPPDEEDEYKNAIVIEATTEKEGIAKEVEYLKSSGCAGKGGVKELVMNEVLTQQEPELHFYDFVKVKCDNGEEMDYYFLIDSFFGKEEPADVSGKKGSSYEDAIVIEAATEMEGVPKEYEYLRNYGCQEKGGVKENLMQELQNYKGSYYDILHVRCNNGEEMDYYFLIDSFFGKI